VSNKSDKACINMKYHLEDNSPMPDNRLVMLVFFIIITILQPIVWVVDMGVDMVDKVTNRNFKFGKDIKPKIRILNFMFVGGIGYIINMAIYYPLMLIFKSDVTFLNTHFYLPPFLISTFIAATSNYLINKAWTFKDKETYKQSYIRYMLACAITVFFDIILLFLLVDYGHIYPAVAAALAILIMFITRYFVVNRWVWKERNNNTSV